MNCGSTFETDIPARLDRLPWTAFHWLLMTALAYGYFFGAALMLLAAVIEWRLGVDSEQKGLEDITSPLSTEAPMQSAVT
jgi:hypothetical protein